MAKPWPDKEKDEMNIPHPGLTDEEWARLLEIDAKNDTATPEEDREAKALIAKLTKGNKQTSN